MESGKHTLEIKKKGTGLVYFGPANPRLPMYAPELKGNSDEIKLQIAD